MKTVDYQQQAQDIANQIGLKMEVEFLKNDFHFVDDKDKRDIYKITLIKGSRKYSFNFGQSIMKSQYYKDRIEGRTYTLNGNPRTGNYRINDLQKYKSIGNQINLIKGEEPELYDVLACLTKYDPGTFEDFCSEFGYDEDSRKAEKTYNGVLDEWQNMKALFSDEELELLQEIQ